MSVFYKRFHRGKLYDTLEAEHKGPWVATHVRQTTTLTLRKEEMKTGQDVIEAGLYASECCGEEVMLEKDASFPRCMKCHSLSIWEPVDIPLEQAA